MNFQESFPCERTGYIAFLVNKWSTRVVICIVFCLLFRSLANKMFPNSEFLSNLAFVTVSKYSHYWFLILMFIYSCQRLLKTCICQFYHRMIELHDSVWFNVVLACFQVTNKRWLIYINIRWWICHSLWIFRHKKLSYFGENICT